MRREARIERLVAVEREYLAASAAVDLLEASLRANPAFGARGGWGLRDARSLRENLEATFLIRLFAEFETSLRDVWRSFFAKATEPPMADLMLAIAAKRSVSQDRLDDADEIRSYRNALVHERAAEVTKVPLIEARRRLCAFLFRLPPEW